MQPKAGKERTLADIILEKIKEKEQAAAAADGGGGDDDDDMAVEGIDEVKPVYRQVGDYCRYTTVRCPRLSARSFRLQLGGGAVPHQPGEMVAARDTRRRDCSRPISTPRWRSASTPSCSCPRRDDIAEHNAYFALRFKKLRSSPAFYKGILIPLCASRTCTLREAVVLSSVMTRGSIPISLRRAAAKLAELPSRTTSFSSRAVG